MSLTQTGAWQGAEKRRELKGPTKHTSQPEKTAPFPRRRDPLPRHAKHPHWANPAKRQLGIWSEEPLFSGRSGYLAYTKELLGRSSEHTAGLYTPLLKQLLIWNLPDRAEMMRTVHHEGFHQFLDRFMPDPPSWFNEGLAQYYETAHLVHGSLTGGQRRNDLLKILKQGKPMPLSRFIYQSSRDFYARGLKSYAQAWALVYFLRTGPKSGRMIFQHLMTVLQENLPARSALDKVFQEVDIENLERGWKRFLETR